MAVKKPLVLGGGRVKELPAADTLQGAIPTGGASGEVLTKNSATDYDVSWAAGGGGGVSEAQVIAYALILGS